MSEATELGLWKQMQSDDPLERQRAEFQMQVCIYQTLKEILGKLEENKT